MKTIRNVLILVDEADTIKEVGRQLASYMAPVHVAIVDAADFAATDLLPADAYFLGCQEPHPARFCEVERVLKGINLAGRPCGLFTLSSKSAIEYLRSISQDAELAVFSEPLFFESLKPVDRAPKVKAWVHAVLGRS
ncbi:hypothetical protein [Gracilinema caldarium]|uniref:Response regulatory domain-containing protein n=1 Tax=Gracilinema caldarium (strain ATCC 51460 / DSM 7334 / H1) TaxID=744872 RepID=F8EYY5_GRAC1|nr:hypothetical protein [Gracilinema caldarium]AEJ18931.1 hypothetical protein Spica_0777 [Gracilinema caldarium DSM 7334]